MNKRLGTVLLIALLLMVGGASAYWMMAHRARQSRAEPEVTFAPETASSARGTASPMAGGAPGGGQPVSATGGAAVSPGFMPRVGESFSYEAAVTQLNSTVANIKLLVAGKRDLAGQNTWHLQGFAHTESPYRMIFELDDQFDSYSESGSFTSVQYEMHLSERGQKVDNVQRLLSSPKEPAPADASAARVPPGTRDPLGLLQYLRGVDWSRTPEVRSPVYDGRKLYQVRAVLAARAVPVAVPAGKYAATKIEIQVKDNGAEMKDAHFVLYLANDAARTPVQMEAVLPVITARVVLTKAN